MLEMDMMGQLGMADYGGLRCSDKGMRWQVDGNAMAT
jgi:hypothetical protein